MMGKVIPFPTKPKTDVHTEHCCAAHGCKYGFGEDATNCSVLNKSKKQSYPCGKGPNTCPGPDGWYY